jgi:hypothetical protein
MAELVIKLVNGELAGKTMQSIRKEISAANRELAKAEVGTKKWVDAQQRLEKAKQLQADLKKQLDRTAEASNNLRGEFDRFIPFAGKFREVGESLGIVRTTVGGLTRSLGALKAALIATGAGAIVVVLGSLISYLTSTQEGIDKVTSVTRPLAAIFQRLIGVAQQLGEQVFDRLAAAVDNPKQAIIDLANAIKDQLLRQLQGFAKFGPALVKIFKGEFREGFKELGNAAIQAATGIENGIDKLGEAAEKVKDFVDEAWEQGKRLDALQKEIEKMELRRIVRSKQLDLIVKQQKKIAEDETASFEERRAAAIAAMDAQQQLLSLEQAVIDKRIEQLKLKQSLNDTSREEEKELAELMAQRLEIEASITEQSIDLRNKLNNINKQELAERKAVEKSLQDLRIESMEEGLEREIAQINKETDQRIVALKGTEAEITEQRELLEKIRQDKIKELREKFAKEQREKDLEEALASHELQMTTELNLLNEQFMARQLSEDEYAMLAAQKAVDFQRQKLDILRQAHGEESQEYQRAYAEFLQLQQAQADQAVAIKKKEMADQVAALQGSLGTFGEFFGTVASMQQEGTAQWKAFATAAAIMSAIQGSINAYTSTAAIPIVGPVLAPLAAAIALAAGMANVRRIQETKLETPVKAALGGEIKGPSHDEGGVVLEAEGGEFIFSKKATAAIGIDQLNRINDYYTRPRFQAGGPVMPFGDRPPIASAAAQAGQAVIPTDEKPAWVDELIAAQDRRIDRIKVVNVVSETEEGIKLLNDIRDEADV